jgi:hypothetical protein
MILENYCRREDPIGLTVDVDLLCAFIQGYGTILGDAADIFVTPVMDIKVGIAAVGWLCYDGKLDSNAIEPGIRPAEKMPVQSRSVAENERPVIVNANRSTVHRHPLDRFS